MSNEPRMACDSACGWPVKPGAITATAVSSPNTSLDTQETSENPSQFSRQMAAYLNGKDGSAPGDAPPLSPDQAFRHSGWEVTRNRVRAALYRTGQSGNRVEQFDECGLNAWVEQNQAHPLQYRLKSSYCHDRLCTPCANERAWRAREALKQIMTDKPHTFITLTLCGKNEKLAPLIDRLYKHFKSLRNHPLWADNVRGGGAFLEIKWSDKANRWHPHLHIICDANFIPQGDLSTTWRTITKDSFIVDIQRIRDKSRQVGYVTKYASKPLNPSFSNTPHLLDEAVIALKGRRLCLTFGTWYNTPLDLIDDEPLIDETTDIYDWVSIGSLYALHKKACGGDKPSQIALAAIRAYERANRFTAGPAG